ncbi:mavicyanin-like [Bidens hawaiensis]|uniref:mavicyanin-like n=1 Tax=Bidens hawaiensis TaxID=980011 RepID=UPI004049B327
MAIATFFLVLILGVATRSAYAVQHIVGDDNGWTNFGDYTTWATGKTFNVGDTLLFNYGGSHGVDVVSKSDYDNCATGNAIDSYTGGTTTVQLKQPGPMYFTCPTFGHCSTGMKLAINVVSTSSDSPGTTTPSDGSNSSPPSTTSPSTPPIKRDAGSTNSAKMVVAGLSLFLAPLFVFMC